MELTTYLEGLMKNPKNPGMSGRIQVCQVESRYVRYVLRKGLHTPIESCSVRMGLEAEKSENPSGGVGRILRVSSLEGNYFSHRENGGKTLGMGAP